ncbi:MAG TPA: preprotein translocase subunit SecG [Gemmatimonadota bacterium]|jgi:preprotein translocase subunit SecG
MLMTFLMVLFFLVSFMLVVVVLLQSGKGGGLAAGFGGSGTGFELLGGRQTASFLHRATTWLGGAFLAIAFAISLLTAHGNRPGSITNAGGAPRPVQQQSGTPEDLQSVVGQDQKAAPAPAPAGAQAPAATPTAPPATQPPGAEAAPGDAGSRP